MKSKQTRSDIFMILTILVMVAAALFAADQFKNSEENPEEFISLSEHFSDETTEKNLSGDRNCTISIYCTNILENMDSLRTGKEKYIPEDGCILGKTAASFSDGETVFDVLKRVCEEANIQLEYAYTPLYKSYYIEGINQIYEFDCGAESGWMYLVNEQYPNYGCSSFEVKDGDDIVWMYTCDGTGNDKNGDGNE